MFEYVITYGEGVMIAHGIADMNDWVDMLANVELFDQTVMACAAPDDAKPERFH